MQILDSSLRKMNKLMMMKLQVYTISLLMVTFFPAVEGNLQRERTCNLQFDSSSTDHCYAQGHRAYPTYSCRPCGISEGGEVHIINMRHAYRGNNVQLTLFADQPVRIKLLLSSHQIVHWKINKPTSVMISQVILNSVLSAYCRVTLENGGYLNVTKRTRRFPLLPETSIIDFARRNLGPVTSYTTVHETCGYWLQTVGNCEPSLADNQSASTPLPGAIRTPPDLTKCSDKLPCWINYNFRLPKKDIGSRCDGDRFVTWYKIEDTTYYVGAILCTNSKYSLFMSTSLQDRFLHIVDSEDGGEDHCELVGSDRRYTPNVEIELEYQFLTAETAYSRSNWGEPFKKVVITTERRPRWYKCGIDIPYSEKSYSESDINPEPKPLGAGIYVVIVVAVLIVVIIVAMCYRTHRKKRQPQATRTEANSDGVWIAVSPNTNEHLEPSAPSASAPSAPMLPDLPPTPPQGERLMEEGAPPAYEDAMNYPLARPKEPESMPPAYEAIPVEKNAFNNCFINLSHHE